MLFAYDGGCDEASKAAAVVATEQSQDRRLHQALQLLDVSGLTVEERARVARDALLSICDFDRLAERTDLEFRAHELAVEPCWFLTPDGVAGPLFAGSNEDTAEADPSIADLKLFLRELSYHSSLQRLTTGREEERLARLTVDCSVAELPMIVPAVVQLLEQPGAVVLKDFLGESLASDMQCLDFGDLSPACPSNDGREAAPGAGRGDWAVLPEEAPMELLERLDALVAALRCTDNCGELLSTADRLDLCEFRTWPMVTSYGPGARYTWHLDNGASVNGRLLTCIYYLNSGWEVHNRGQLRLLDWEHSTTAGESPSLRVLAEVPPELDTLVIFWSDKVPHEVLPPLTGSRRAISVWYLCPRLGAEHFEADNAEPAFGQTTVEAASKILKTWKDNANKSGAVYKWLRAAAECDEDHICFMPGELDAAISMYEELA